MNRNGKVNILFLYLHRYIRTTPLLAASILISVSLLRFLGNGPFWPIVVDFNGGHCTRYWWSTLLHVQNYVNSKKIVRIQNIFADMRSYF